MSNASKPNITNFALIGAGSIAAIRKSALDGATSAQCGGVFDIAHDKALALAGSSTCYATLEEALTDPAVDCVIVSTPPHTHEEITIQALQAGKHVLVEKPMAPSVEACQRMIDTAEKCGKILTVGFNHRYFPAIRDVTEAVQSGAIGKLNYVRAFAGHTGLSEFKSEWMYSKSTMGGGALMDNGIHLIDLVQHVVGPIENVYGKALDDIWKLDVEDNAFGILTGANGVVASLNASWTEWKGYHFYIEAYGSHGMARAFYAPMRSTIITMSGPGAKPKTKTNYYLPLIFKEKFQGWQSTTIHTLISEIEDFVSLTKGQQPSGPIASGKDGMSAVEIAHAIYDSSKSNTSLTLSVAQS